ncbi:CPY1 [Symbiodinium natans]|uniref:CPY1 protein n=1 Tax=Symbiodinium natans TaxID=878477 RepID=A0A812LXW9_9DINO|nr:CPY1 [Symbiodinium natans]
MNNLGCRAPTAGRRSAASGWARRWWGLLSVAVQVAVAEIALGPTAAGLQPAGFSAVPALEAVLALADCAGPGLPPLRPSTRETFLAAETSVWKNK